jgi:hypothetical protein|tara:strand:- start:194 stop:463 length:270 start_codon:yes stop_codon:yes gene_type:complete
MGIKISERVKSFVSECLDCCPPYKTIEGLLEVKEVDDQERHFIYVSSEKVQVDSATFEILMIGENLKVRFTRGNKAINIDRLIPTQGPV